MSNFERCSIAFSATDVGKSNIASYQELATIATAFATAQKKGPSHWVHVKNLIGIETLWAALVTVFIADIKIGVIHAIIPSVHLISTKSSADGLGVGILWVLSATNQGLSISPVNLHSLLEPLRQFVLNMTHKK